MIDRNKRLEKLRAKEKQRKRIHVDIDPDIRGVDNKDRYGHRVNLSVLSSDNSYELYSKQLIEKLCALITDLDTSYNYRLTGEFITDENAAVFSLNTLQKIEPLEAK